LNDLIFCGEWRSAALGLSANRTKKVAPQTACIPRTLYDGRIRTGSIIMQSDGRA
jgi:hypothetical protein